MNKNLGRGNSISASRSNCICYCFSMTHVHISISFNLLDVLSYAEDNNNRYILRKPVHHIISCWTACFFCWHEQHWNLQGVKCNSMFVYLHLYDQCLQYSLTTNHCSVEERQNLCFYQSIVVSSFGSCCKSWIWIQRCPHCWPKNSSHVQGDRQVKSSGF